MSNSPAPADAPSDWLHAIASRDPDQELIETGEGRRLSYGVMAQLTTRVAGALARCGVAPVSAAPAALAPSLK